MGYRIAQAYYEQVKDKNQAVSEILDARVFRVSQAESRYAEQFRVD
jgi:hypothetical protein